MLDFNDDADGDGGIALQPTLSDGMDVSSASVREPCAVAIEPRMGNCLLHALMAFHSQCFDKLYRLSSLQECEKDLIWENTKKRKKI